MSIALARALIRNGARGRFYNVADFIFRLDFVIMGELGYLHFAQEVDMRGHDGFPGKKDIRPTGQILFVVIYKGWRNGNAGGGASCC